MRFDLEICFFVVAAGCAPHGTSLGRAPAAFDATRACGHWQDAAHGNADASSHVASPESSAPACFVRVRYDGENATPDPAAAGCGYRAEDAREAIEAEVDRYARIARGEQVQELPLELACALSDRDRRAAAANNARTLGDFLASQDARVRMPYAAIATFGFGDPSHAGTVLDHWLPGEACPSGVDLHRFGANVDRAARAALALEGHVAPLVIVSGGAIHSRLVEAFLLDYIATCRIGAPRDRILLDPCANHTHTNIRNAGRILRGIGGRTSYLVTDDALQAAYLGDWTIFDLIGGSLDQRSLRDWGFLLGSWHQASVGIDAGFWYTPYRFWSDPRYRDFSCVR